MASKKKTEEVPTESTLAAAVAGIDREALAPKTRLYALAKQVGVASKELVAQFAHMGIKKSAQSSLTPEEVGQLIDALVPATEAPEQAATEDNQVAAEDADQPEVSAEDKPHEDRQEEARQARGQTREQGRQEG